jgi:hypothetical protein
MLALSGGCQSGSGDGLPVSGRLHQGDRPVETDGVLTLLPERSSSAPAVSTPITEGHFEFRRENGPRAGRYQALVNLFEADDPGQAPGAGDKLGPLGPPERGELRIAVEIAAEGPWVLDLQLPADHPEASR